VELTVENAPLDQVVRELQKKLGVPIRLDIKALKDVGITATAPVTFNGLGVSAKSALRLMLHEHGLTWTVRYETLLITSPEEAADHLLCGGDDSDLREPDFDSLIDLIKNTVRPTSWDDTGGPGSIAPFFAAGSAAIVVSQTEEVFEQLESLLSDLREMRDAHGRQMPPDGRQRKYAGASARLLPAVVVRFSPKPSAVERAVRETLDKQVNLQFKDAPLSEVIEQLQKITNLPIVVDQKALERFHGWSGAIWGGMID
jgi:hypothetical protein